MDKKIQTLILLAFFLAFAACDSEDDSPENNSPNLTYPSTTLTATLGQNGSSSAPSINWNGAQGNVSIAPPIEGLSVNSTNGVISWDGRLPIGTTEFQIVASNDAGQVTANMMIENPLQGQFVGTYAGAYDFELIFDNDGSLEVKADGTTALGNWELNGTIFTADYVYVDFPDIDYYLDGNFTQGTNQVVLSGSYYPDSSLENPIDVYEVTLQ